MKKIMKKFAVIGVIAAAACAMLTGCSIGKPTINLNDYVSVECTGRNGSGDVNVSIEYVRMVEDYPDAIEEDRIDPIFGDETYSVVANMAFDQYDPFDISFADLNNYGNGDKVQIDISIDQNAVKNLQQFFNVDFKFKPITYQVEGLAEIQEIDPFQNLPVDCYGISGEDNSCADQYTTKKAYDPVTDRNASIQILLQIEENKDYQNGDSVHAIVDMDENKIEDLERNYGLRLSRTEADIILEDFDYIPYDNPAEIFEHTTEADEENIRSAMMEGLKEYQQDDGEPTLVGKVYFYDDPGYEREISLLGLQGPAHFAYIYHLEDGNVEGGYYYYMLSSQTAVIRTEVDENGNKYKISSVEGYGHASDSQYAYYHDRDEDIFHSNNVPATFDYNGARYHGHRDINECVSAMLENDLGSHPYANFIVDEDLIANGYTG